MRYNAIEQRGLNPLTKCTAAMRTLAYGIAADCIDQYLKIGASTALECMKNFALGMIEVFGNECLRKPMLIAYFKLQKLETFPVCWDVSIACTGSQRIVP